MNPDELVLIVCKRRGIEISDKEALFSQSTLKQCEFCSASIYVIPRNLKKFDNFKLSCFPCAKEQAEKEAKKGEPTVVFGQQESVNKFLGYLTE